MLQLKTNRYKSRFVLRGHFKCQEIMFKATFSVHKPILQNGQMTTLYTNWSLYITFTMIYYIRQE